MNYSVEYEAEALTALDKLTGAHSLYFLLLRDL